MRVKGNGAIEMGPRWSKDRRAPWRVWSPMDGRKSKGRGMPTSPPGQASPVGSNVEWAVTGTDSYVKKKNFEPGSAGCLFSKGGRVED